mgnify:CR=1 FL=1
MTGPHMPVWMKRRRNFGPEFRVVEKVLEENSLHTVCESARCPNRHECFSRGTATFMILGDRCTILAVRERLPGAVVEVLTPDFAGSMEAVDTVLKAAPDVFNHNVETVPRLYGRVRPQAVYQRSLSVLERASGRVAFTKSGFMVGLGERMDEVTSMLEDLRGAGCELVTAGQYLRPNGDCLPVERFWSPEEFRWLEEAARSAGFQGVVASPYARSSYLAGQLTKEVCGNVR